MSNAHLKAGANIIEFTELATVYAGNLIILTQNFLNNAVHNHQS
ncbi:hypothetical protein SAMN04488009_0694 [Maribacter sedimenticola]|uniref:Uncharacterized protein n=1 Tax=Maribacter sedimenticola TaxID=228956 RepID=A0ABY1SD52_9FLAO|nr:hypothetical protein [Maribacter sedimenticola]SNR27776.1 hypothetical protein SAMN04488009_0694 [Maribacter sedimenticola]